MRYLQFRNALQGTLVWKKMILYEIFQVGACPNLKDSSLYDRFSIHMYKTWSVRFLWLFCAICDSLHFLKRRIIFFCGKKWFFFHEIFQAGACPNLKVSSIHEFFFYSYVQDRYSSVPSTVFAFCDSLMLCKVHYFGKRWYFMKYFKLVHAPTWKIP